MVSESAANMLADMIDVSLNPCFSGGWSRRLTWLSAGFAGVLILVLVEDGLGEIFYVMNTDIYSDSLNPCFSGGWSRRW